MMYYDVVIGKKEKGEVSQKYLLKLTVLQTQFIS